MAKSRWLAAVAYVKCGKLPAPELACSPLPPKKNCHASSSHCLVSKALKRFEHVSFFCVLLIFQAIFSLFSAVASSFLRSMFFGIFSFHNDQRQWQKCFWSSLSPAVREGERQQGKRGGRGERGGSTPRAHCALASACDARFLCLPQQQQQQTRCSLQILQFLFFFFCFFCACYLPSFFASFSASTCACLFWPCGCVAVWLSGWVAITIWLYAWSIHS